VIAAFGQELTAILLEMQDDTWMYL